MKGTGDRRIGTCSEPSAASVYLKKTAVTEDKRQQTGSEKGGESDASSSKSERQGSEVSHTLSFEHWRDGGHKDSWDQTPFKGTNAGSEHKKGWMYVHNSKVHSLHQRHWKKMFVVFDKELTFYVKTLRVFEGANGLKRVSSAGCELPGVGEDDVDR
jgi:hypothetical protein